MENYDLLKSLTVVFVEDDLLIRGVIAKSLKRKIGNVYEADNGEDGLKLIEQHKPDVIITDIEMPVMDGIKMIREVRKRYDDKQIIVITAYQDEAHFTELADAYIYKPIKVRLIFEEIIKIMKLKKQLWVFKSF